MVQGSGLIRAVPDGGCGVGWKRQGPGEDREVPPVVRLHVMQGYALEAGGGPEDPRREDCALEGGSRG